MSNVTVYVKMMSGEMIELEVSENITYEQFDWTVYEALPNELRPSHRYQMGLFRMCPEDEKDAEEVVPSDERLKPMEGECFSVFLMVDEFELRLEIGASVSTYLALEDDDDEMEILSVYIYKNNVLIHSEPLYYTLGGEGTWYRREDVEENWMGRHSDEIAVQIRENAKAYRSIHDVTEAIFQSCPNHESVKGIVPRLSLRLVEHLRRAFVAEWGYLWETNYG